MTTLLYDGSFEGLFTAIFEVFEYKYEPAEIIAKENYLSENMFSNLHEVLTSIEKSDRVLKKLEKNIGKTGVSKLLKVYLSERKDVEFLVLNAVKKSIKNPTVDVLLNYSDDEILEIAKINKSVNREIHRMHAFVRFEKLKDDVYFAKIEPDFNVLPLIVKHFKDRYQDQKWMIYDLKRHYGVFYDLKTMEFFNPESDQIYQFQKIDELLHDEEKRYQKLWQRYFFKTNIPERKNLKLHYQHVPKRYWKYLTEKL
ncbi:TIGR03915 family putative DNA repair protein [Frigoriflavimonas asaccharolytica]|uniref:Putative DNA metabolism protein n=1 Tax=Frigoriflavimonas asaccharolytica TaxID=2735899 RepID=A0A8J8K717_9FLAO|nr:TIGR03915 family putative DNA repair protein [Frigoriflavimonas asaccharolytica]NRS91533.1 putative DNA metabolism protein [Frigoriflavimonas asaccharolytica]